MLIEIAYGLPCIFSTLGSTSLLSHMYCNEPKPVPSRIVLLRTFYHVIPACFIYGLVVCQSWLHKWNHSLKWCTKCWKPLKDRVFFLGNAAIHFVRPCHVCLVSIFFGPAWILWMEWNQLENKVPHTFEIM